MHRKLKVVMGGKPNPDCPECGGRGFVLLSRVRYQHPVDCPKCFDPWDANDFTRSLKAKRDTELTQRPNVA